MIDGGYNAAKPKLNFIRQRFCEAYHQLEGRLPANKAEIADDPTAARRTQLIECPPVLVAGGLRHKAKFVFNEKPLAMVSLNCGEVVFVKCRRRNDQQIDPAKADPFDYSEGDAKEARRREAGLN